MAKIIGSLMVTLNKQCKYSSSVSKNGISSFDGRSASIFRISTNYSINP
ncbi:MAG: hypothetical protein GX370_01930 [Clostridia bacterium]|nr:hypothetical protein [Clostridia bacterium]